MERAKPVPPEEWERRVQRWRDSGLSAKEFASELGINANSLTTWATRLRQGYDRAAEAEDARRRRAHKKAARKAPPLSLVEVKADAPTPAAESFELVVGRCSVRVPASFDEAALRRLLSVLEAGT